MTNDEAETWEGKQRGGAGRVRKPEACVAQRGVSVWSKACGRGFRGATLVQADELSLCPAGSERNFDGRAVGLGDLISKGDE